MYAQHLWLTYTEEKKRHVYISDTRQDNTVCLFRMWTRGTSTWQGAIGVHCRNRLYLCSVPPAGEQAHCQCSHATGGDVVHLSLPIPYLCEIVAFFPTTAYRVRGLVLEPATLLGNARRTNKKKFDSRCWLAETVFSGDYYWWSLNWPICKQCGALHNLLRTNDK